MEEIFTMPISTGTHTRTPHSTYVQLRGSSRLFNALLTTCQPLLLHSVKPQLKIGVIQPLQLGKYISTCPRKGTVV